MEKKEFKVGEIFQCGLVKLKCVEKFIDETERCARCFLDHNGECIDGFGIIVGNCSHTNREDKTNVIFVKIEE